ncbi:MAG: HNH endonuclease [Halobacteriovoraceae bacterium]|nr:HNH endonuclease [Halobacteriovoraceae bacterium]
MNTVGWFAFSLLVLWVSFLNLRIWKKKNLKKILILKKLEEDLQKDISFLPRDYVIPKNSYKRSNRVERRFRKRYFFELLEEFNHQCFGCKRAIKVECDHFFLPKSKGGNLMMLHREGYWICNTILLCRACNSRKEDKLPQEFFSKEQIQTCQGHLKKISKLISEREL